MSKSQGKNHGSDGESAAAKAGGPYEGVRPKNAACVKCAYVFGGVAIRSGVIVCPECGHQNRFEFEKVTVSRKVRGYGLSFRILAFALIVVLGTLLFQRGGWMWLLTLVALTLVGSWGIKELMRMWVER